MTRRLDALVAERVMGWELDIDGEAWTYGEEFLPSSSIDHAWRVVEKLVNDTSLENPLYFKLVYKWEPENSKDGCFAVFDWKGTSDTRPLYTAFEDSAPLAFCIAALRAVGVSQSEIDAAMTQEVTQ